MFCFETKFSQRNHKVTFLNCKKLRTRTFRDLVECLQRKAAHSVHILLSPSSRFVCPNRGNMRNKSIQLFIAHDNRLLSTTTTVAGTVAGDLNPWNDAEW